MEPEFQSLNFGGKGISGLRSYQPAWAMKPGTCNPIVESRRGHHYGETWPRSYPSYPKPGLKCRASAVGDKHSRKEPFEQLIHLTILIHYSLNI